MSPALSTPGAAWAAGSHAEQERIDFDLLFGHTFDSDTTRIMTVDVTVRF